MEKRACAILRNGYESCHPEDNVTNRELLQREVGDVMASLELMADTVGEAKDLDMEAVEFHKRAKLERVQKYLHHQ